jgi:hypothetical protein
VRRYLFLAVPPLFYGLTAAPGIAHADQAILIHSMFNGVLDSGATHHNFTVLAGYLAIHALPFGEIAYRANLVSVLFGALAVDLFYVAALRITRSALVGALAALCLMTSHSLWWHSTVAEVYAANAMFCMAILLCLVFCHETRRRGFLDLAGLLAGLAVFNHAQMGIWAPAVLLFAWQATAGPGAARVRAVLRTGAGYAVGLVPYFAVFLRDVARRGLGGVTVEARGGEFSRLFMSAWPPAVFLEQVAETARLFMLQWGWPSLFLLYIPLGLAAMLRERARSPVHGAVATAFAINTGFFAFYPTWDRYAFLLPSFVLAAYPGLLGINWLWQGPLRKRPSLAALVAVATAIGGIYPAYFFDRLPRVAAGSRLWARYRPDSRTSTAMFDGEYIANPNKRDYRRIQRFARRVFERLPPDALLIDQIARTYFQLTYYYQQFYVGPRPRIVLFVPTGLDLSKWHHGVDTAHALELVTTAPSLEKVFLSSVYGCNEIVIPLLARGITFVEYPLDSDLSVFQARAVADLDLGSWVERAEVGLDAAVLSAPRSSADFGEEDAGRLAAWVRLRPRNPPMRVRVDWVGLEQGLVVPGVPYDLPFDVAPVVFHPPPGQRFPAGRWRADVYCFDRLVAQREFRVR